MPAKKEIKVKLPYLTDPKYQENDIVDTNGNIIPKEKRNEIIDQIKSLPIISQINDIATSIRNNLITIIEAKTGSGKTTQIGKVAYFTISSEKKRPARINMTQPRVISAISNATRISDEMLAVFNNPQYSLGEVIGYRTGNYDNSSENTKILLTTDAQEVLRELVSEVMPDCLILDEVHTYTIDIEILLALMKQKIAENPNISTKFVIMTATLDKDLIISYLKNAKLSIPYFEVPGKVFPIEEQILPSKEFISSIIENIDFTGNGKVLAFVDGKRSIFQTINKLEEKLGKEKIQSYINSINLELDKIYTEVELNLENVSEYLKKYILEKFNNLLRFSRQEFEQKIKKPYYQMNYDKITGDLYDIFNPSEIDLEENEKENLSRIYNNLFDKLSLLLDKLHDFDYKIEDIIKIIEKFERKISKTNVSEKYFSYVNGYIFSLKNFLYKMIEKGVDEKFITREIQKFKDLQNKLSDFIEIDEGLKKYIDKNFKEFITELNNLCKMIENYYGTEIKIVPLHADLSKEEQDKAFDEDTKVIIATNVAEMSLTIPNITTIVDSGLEKIAYLNEKGIPVLEVVNISKAQSKQRKGRTGRTGPGKYIWTNNSDPDNLQDFPTTDIEKGGYARHYLILLAGGKKFEDIEFMHKPKKEHIEIIKQHLRKIGAINEEGELTKIGEEIVTIPTEPYIARMLYEAEKRNCLGNMIILGSILETRSFLSSENDNWKKINFPNQARFGDSDLYCYYEWYKFLTSKKISKDFMNQLILIGLDPKQIKEFNNNDKSLFEAIDLNKLGIKEKYFSEVLLNIERLTKYYEEKGSQITEKEISNKDIKYSLISGLNDNIFEWDGKKMKNQNKGYFEKSTISTIKPLKSKDYVYLGLPFIIKNPNRKDKNIIQKLTRIEKSMITEVLAERDGSCQFTLTSVLKKKKVNGKTIKIRKKVLKQIKPIEGIDFKNILFETGNNSFKYMFTKVYLPEFLLRENKWIQKLVKEIEDNAPEGLKVNIKKLKKIIGKHTSELYEFFEKSELSPRKIEENFRNDKTIYDKIIQDSDSIFDLYN